MKPLQALQTISNMLSIETDHKILKIQVIGLTGRTVAKFAGNDEKLD